MKLFNRLLSLMLAAALLTGLLVLPASAEELQQAEGSGYLENPLFDYHPDFEPEALLLEDSQSAVSEHTDATYLSVTAAVGQLRDAMAARKTNFTIYIQSAYQIEFNTVLSDAVSEAYAVSPETGDYLSWSWSKIRWDYSYTQMSNGVWQYVYNVKAVYYNTAEQEQTFKTKLNEVMEELDVWEDSDYLKYQAIYNYILEHVTYDYTGLATHDDDISGKDEEYGGVDTYIDVLGNNDNLIYTAYDALCNGKAVCQGYSCLLYAMCRSCGLNVRIQAGANHSWNIVQLGDLWYYMDATWDAQRGTASRVCFLKGTTDFTGHYPNSTYQTAAYTAAHPMAAAAYEPQDSDYEKVLPFRDVSEDAYYYTPVCKTYEWGIFTGTSHYQFRPEQQMTRAMVVTVLYRMAGKPDCGTDSGFTDVSQSQYYAPAIAWAVQKGITNGTSTTTFSPNATVTREQFAAFLYRYAKMMGYDVSASAVLTQYQDRTAISAYALPAMQWAVGFGVINGTSSTTLSPQGTATRGQVATMLYRFITNYGLDEEMSKAA